MMDQSGNLSHQNRRIRVEWTKGLREQLAAIAENQSELIKSQGALELRLIEKMETNHTSLSRDLVLLRNDVIDLRASYTADKQSYERRLTQLEARPSSTWEMDKTAFDIRLKAIEDRPRQGWNRATVIIAGLALVSSNLLGIAGLVLSLLTALHVIGR
jgi:hypothetical protein